MFADLGDMPEDRRIDCIGKCVEAGKTVGFIVESKKIGDRYIKKLLLDFPNLVVLAKFDGPVSQTITIKVGPKPKTP